jgi:hypothetical protein
MAQDETDEKATTAGTSGYAVVTSEQIESYCESEGAVGRALATFDGLGEARAYAEAVAMDYHYGVEIVDLATWTVSA